MAFLATVLIVGLYVAVGLWIVAKSPGWWRLVALLAVILIPTADALWGRYVTLPRLCKDAGLKVYGKASREGGLMLSTADDYLLTKYGFPFVEGVDGARKVYRRSMRDSQPALEPDVQPLAKYRLRAIELRPAQGFEGTSYRIEEIESGRPIGEFATYAFTGGWAERLLSQFTDSGVQYVAGCGHGDANSRVDNLIASVFGG